MHTTTPPPPPPLPRQAEEKKGDGFLAAVTKSWLPFFTAILVLATAALGLYTKQVADQRDEAQAGSDELEAEKQQLEQQIAELEEQKAGLEQELEAQETAVTTPTTRGGTTAPTDDATPEVLRQSGAAPVTIAWNRGIDLDTDAANWDVGSSGDVVYSSGAVSGRLSQFVLVTAPPTPSECAASTLPVGYLPEEQAVVGQQFCVHTDEERWAYVRIAAIDSDARTISFDVTVWKLPTDP
ncbi:MAG TPA: hypothetical protein VFB77_10250 [Acidimicrobiales bacterium]|nr:hypothetical protein [Acidimicrobiales bacterium]